MLAPVTLQMAASMRMKNGSEASRTTSSRSAPAKLYGELTEPAARTRQRAARANTNAMKIRSVPPRASAPAAAMKPTWPRSSGSTTGLIWRASFSNSFPTS